MRFARGGGRGGVRGNAPVRKFIKMVQFGTFWGMFGSYFVFKKS